MKWNDDWRKELKEQREDVFYRLTSCCNTLEDISIISVYMARYNPNRTYQEALDRTIEWVCDWNNQFELFDLLEKIILDLTL